MEPGCVESLRACPLARGRADKVTLTSRTWIARGRAAGWPIAEQFAGPLAQLVLTPFLLHRMEPREFALWVIAQSLVVAAPTLSLGQSVALLSVLPRYGGAERDARTRALVRHTTRLVSLMSLAAAVVVLAGNAALGRMRPELAGTSLYLLLLIGFIALIECESTLTSALKSYRAFAQTATIEIVARAVQVGLVLALVDSGAQVNTVLALWMVVIALKLALKGLTLRWLTGTPDPAHAAPANVPSDMLHLGFWSWVNVVSGVAFYSFDRWAVGALMGSVALGAYSVCSQLAQLTHSVPAAAAQMLIPWASARGSAASHVNTGRQMRAVAFVSAGFACILPLFLLALAPEILSYWISPAFAVENTVLLRHLAFVFLLLTINIPFFNILIGLGFMRYAALLTIFAGSLYAASVVFIAPQSPVTMADLKLIYAVIGLVFVAKLLQTLKGMTPK